MWKQNCLGHSRPIRNAILIGNDRPQKDFIAFWERSRAGDFLAALIISPSDLTCDTVAATAHHSLVDTAEFGSAMGNRWDIYWATQLQFADRRREIWKGSKTLGEAYNYSGYQPQGEAEGMFDRIGLGESPATLVYATNQAGGKLISLKSQIERYSEAEANDPTPHRPKIVETNQQPAHTGEIVILGGGGPKLRLGDQENEERLEVTRSGLWRMYPVEVLEPLRRKSPRRQDGGEMDNAFRNGGVREMAKRNSDRPDLTVCAVQRYKMARNDWGGSTGVKWGSCLNLPRACMRCGDWQYNSSALETTIRPNN